MGHDFKTKYKYGCKTTLSNINMDMKDKIEGKKNKYLNAYGSPSYRFIFISNTGLSDRREYYGLSRGQKR